MAIVEKAIPALSDSLLYKPDIQLRAPKLAYVDSVIPAATIPMPASLLHQSLLADGHRPTHGVQS